MIYPNSSDSAVQSLENQRLRSPSRVHSVLCCDNCKEKIYRGEDYLECVGGIFCRRCVMHELGRDDLMDIMGYEFTEAE